MSKFSRALFFLACVTPRTGLARDPVEVNFTAVAREYCHVLRFPSGWQMPVYVARYDLSGDYEFRVPGLLSTRFLVRGVEELGRKYYTTNLYEVDLSDAKGVAQPAKEEEWDSATPVPLRYTGPADALAKYIQSRGFPFAATGDHGAVTRLSPDRAVLIYQSWSGRLSPCGGGNNDGIVPGPCFDLIGSRGKLFFDVYNADTGKKLIRLIANFSGIRPEEAFNKTGFVTERYFFIPLDERRERCLVCEFGRKR